MDKAKKIHLKKLKRKGKKYTRGSKEYIPHAEKHHKYNLKDWLYPNKIQQLNIHSMM